MPANPVDLSGCMQVTLVVSLFLVCEQMVLPGIKYVVDYLEHIDWKGLILFFDSVDGLDYNPESCIGCLFVHFQASIEHVVDNVHYKYGSAKLIVIIFDFIYYFSLV